MMHYTATDIVLIITAICTGICSVIAAARANSAANLSFKSNVKLDEAKDKIEEVHKTTNGNLSKLEDKCFELKQGNRYYRSMIIEYMKLVPKEESARIKTETDEKGFIRPQMLDSPLFSFRDTDLKED